MPAEAHGTVVQLAESHGHPETRAELLAHVAAHGPNEQPRWWNDPAPADQARPRACGVSCCARPMLPAAVEVLRRACSKARSSTNPTGASISSGHAVPGSASSSHPDAPPGVDRLEVDGLDEPAR